MRADLVALNESLEEGEPIFVLRASDGMSPQFVRMWTSMLLHHRNKDGGPFPLREVREADVRAAAMEVWKASRDDVE